MDSKNNIKQVQELGQQIWLDNLSRSFLNSKEFEQLYKTGVTGITTNPAIFSKAIATDKSYQKELADLEERNLTPKEKYEHFAIQDVQQACDKFADIYKKSDFEYGYVSIELDPYLSQNEIQSIQEAKYLWQSINRPNLMIKVPATEVGIKIFETLIRIGINVNITLLFSLKTTQQVHQAYLNGLKFRLADKRKVEHVRAVASFFLSRIDTALDVTLPEHLQGKVAISIAKQAYQDWLAIFNTKQLSFLQQHSAKPTRLLWASTGTKNPNYSSLIYVDNLVGKDTINTLPDATLKYFLDKGRPQISITNNVEEAQRILREVSQLGISLETLAMRLQEEGLLQFEEAFQKILNQLA